VGQAGVPPADYSIEMPGKMPGVPTDKMSVLLKDFALLEPRGKRPRFFSCPSFPFAVHLKK
jgi:hypothetical protein